MHLKKLSLLNYKNLRDESFDFDARINCLVGRNGIGKTNVLDAIYHLAFGKSYFNPLAVQNIAHGEDFFVVDGEFEKDGRSHHVVCSLRKGQKKMLKHNGKPVEKISEHVGFIPLVMISPADRDLITEGSDERRKFIDLVISQLDQAYLATVIQYNKVLTQRNALLKYFAINRTHDADTLGVYNDQLNDLGRPVFEARQAFMREFVPIFERHYNTIAGSVENVGITYKSDLQEADYLALLSRSFPRDKVLQYTTTGIHKDDLIFEIEGHPIRKFGSQGQQKSFLIALKLAQFEFVKKRSGQHPILLFDDIFDKLDEFRVAKIVDMVNNDDFGQIFISDTHAARTEEIVRSTHQSYRIFNLK